MVVCFSRNVDVAIEQPINSILYHHPSMKAALETIGARRIIAYAGQFGAPSRKPLEIYTTLPENALTTLRTTQKGADARVKVIGNFETGPGRVSREGWNGT
eukprot:5016899-Pyramimonas_sp.AAC.1